MYGETLASIACRVNPSPSERFLIYMCTSRAKALYKAVHSLLFLILQHTHNNIPMPSLQRRILQICLLCHILSC
jgi:hypothetical protein